MSFGSMEEVVCDRDDLIFNPLYNFEPVKGLEYLLGRCEDV